MDRESGFTTLEALAGLIILGVVAAAAGGAASSGIRGFRATRETSITAARVLVLDDYLRRAAREIRIPYWERRVRVEAGLPGWRIGWWLAQADQVIRVEETDDGMAVTTPEGSRVFRDATVLAVSPIPDMDGPPRGLRVRYRVRELEFVTEAEFGAWAPEKAYP